MKSIHLQTVIIPTFAESIRKQCFSKFNLYQPKWTKNLRMRNTSLMGDINIDY